MKTHKVGRNRIVPERYAYKAFTGGGEDFLVSGLHVGWHVGTSPVTIPQVLCFSSSWRPAWHSGPLACPAEVFHATVRHQQAVFVHFMSMDNTESTKCFNFFDTQLSMPAPHHPLGMYALYKRGQCWLMNAWFDNHERLGRCTVLASMTSLPFKQITLQGTTWLQNEGTVIMNTCQVWMPLP